MENETYQGDAPLDDLRNKPPVKIMPDGIQWNWWYCEKYPSQSEYLYYFYWWNWLSPTSRYWGYYSLYYDGVHHSFGFWFFNWSWNWVPGWLVKLKKRS